ncbi:MAG: hypothetical protein ABW171_14375 [Steroidobacter sp.]
MFTRIQIVVALALATVAWGAVLWYQGISITWEHLAPFSTVVAVLTGVALVMEHWAWRLRCLQGWLFSRPDLRGTWKVTLHSEWIDPKTGERVPPIAAYAGIVQTLSTLQIHLMAPDAESCLLANSVQRTACGKRFEIAVVYANTPKVGRRGPQNERHVGASIMTTHGESTYKPTSMTAEYWTDRRTIGRMTFEHRVPVVYSRYEDAVKNRSNFAR